MASNSGLQLSVVAGRGSFDVSFALGNARFESIDEVAGACKLVNSI